MSQSTRKRICIWLAAAFVLASRPMDLSGQIGPMRPFGQLHALVVGVSKYQNPQIDSLRFAHRDARIFADFLQKEALWQVAPDRLTLLTNEEATYGAFINSLQVISEQCSPGDRLILYFAGHGDVERTAEDDLGYLLLHDASATTYAAGGACNVLTLDNFLRKLTLEKDVEVIFISDACRSGELAGKAIQGAQVTATAMAQLFSNTVKILSCEADQYSIEDERWGNGRGLFSYYLVRGLQGEADRDQNRYVEMLELERYVQDSVRAQSGNQQTPFAQGGSSSLRLNKVPEQIEPPQAVLQNLIRSDTSYLDILDAFEEALARKQLLYPEENSALALYESLQAYEEAATVRRILKVRLASALQDEAQQALNDYIATPSKELSRRWQDATIYQRYPEYLARAADLLGQNNSFFNDIKSREFYFRGVNLRLRADETKPLDTILLREALDWQERALNTTPDAPHIQNELGLIYRRLGTQELELQAFQRACALSPTWGLSLTNLAHSYYLREEYGAAELLYQEAIALDETLPLTHYDLAVLYGKNQQPEKAIKELQRTIALDSSFAEAYYNLAYLYVEQPGQQQAAAEMMTKYLELEPTDADGHSMLGYILDLLQQSEAAKAAFRQAISLRSDDLFALEMLAILERRSQHFEVSISLWEKCVTVAPNEFNYQLELAKTHVLAQQYRQGLSVIEQMLQRGYRDEAALRDDPDLALFPENSGFQALLDTYFR